MKIYEHNIETDTAELRDMNADEIKAWQKYENDEKIYLEKQAQAATDKAALLAKLGITADEAKLLLS